MPSKAKMNQNSSFSKVPKRRKRQQQQSGQDHSDIENQQVSGPNNPVKDGTKYRVRKKARKCVSLPGRHKNFTQKSDNEVQASDFCCENWQVPYTGGNVLLDICKKQLSAEGAWSKGTEEPDPCRQMLGDHARRQRMTPTRKRNKVVEISLSAADGSKRENLLAQHTKKVMERALSHFPGQKENKSPETSCAGTSYSRWQDLASWHFVQILYERARSIGISNL